MTDGSGLNSRLLLVRDFSSRITNGRFGTGGRPLGVLVELGEPISVASRGLFRCGTGSETSSCDICPEVGVVVSF